jgi:peptidoglycan/LPS O-acetylase OafA/YrhL
MRLDHAPFLIGKIALVSGRSAAMLFAGDWGPHGISGVKVGHCYYSTNMRAKYQSNASRYVRPLTGIRALAALMVLGMHTEQNVPAGLDRLFPFFARGYLGVDFFFVLSGYIITHVYFANLASPNLSAVRIFLWHRFIRLYPVHITVLAALVAIVSFGGAAGFALNNPQEWQWNDLLWQLTLLQAWGVTRSPGWNAPSWSISAEWFAYLLFPLLAPALNWVRQRGIALLIAVTALTAMALLFAMADWTLNTWVGAPALTRVFGEFLCGAALCRAVALSHEWPLPRGDVLGTGAFIAFLFGASVGLQDVALIPLLALTILGAAISGGHLARLLGSRPFVWLGDVSYSVYMVHFPVLIVIRRFWERLGFSEWQLAGKIFAFLATVVLVVALAAMLFYVVERPARVRLRDHMGKFAPA